MAKKPPDPDGSGVVSFDSPSCFSEEGEFMDCPSPAEHVIIAAEGSSLSRKRRPNLSDSSDNTPKVSRIEELASPVQVLKYSVSDSGPFLVHVYKVEEDRSAGTYIHPVKFGHFIYYNKFDGIKEGGIKKIGRNRIAVEFSSADAANLFVGNSLLSDKGYSAVIPSYCATRMGVARGIPVDYTNEELIEFVRVPNSIGRVLKVRRLNYKPREVANGNKDWLPSETVVFTFEGQKLPSNIYLFHNSVSVAPYRFPIIQCFRCLRYGHVQAQCRSGPRCCKCSQPHTGDSCTVDPENVSCLFCGGCHSALDRSCPERARQSSIKLTMSQDCVSFQEASKRHPQRRLYADCLKSAVNCQSQATSAFIQTSQPQHGISRSKSPQPLKVKPKKIPQTGFDQKAHRELVNSFIIPSPQDGCALRQKVSNGVDTAVTFSDSFDLLNSLVMCLISLISSNTPIPPNVAENIVNLLKLITNHGPSASMECQKH